MVCIPFHDIKLAQKEGFRTRDAHLYKHFSESGRLDKTVIFNRPTMLAEIILRKKSLLTHGDLIYSGGGIFVTKIHDSLFSVDVLDGNFLGPVLKGKRFIPELYVRNFDKYKRALEFLGIKEFITYESSPLTVAFCKKLDPLSRVFDGVDNLCKHSTYQGFREFLGEMYRYVIDSYDVVLFNSTDSIDYFEAAGKENVTFLPNGVDFEFFAEPGKCPELLTNLPRPIVVYAGKMQEMLDVELISLAAKKFPAATFVLLGKVLDKGIKSKLSIVKNVVFGGDIKYEGLPGYLQCADVCFIPYRVDKQHGGDPIKFYEYMAVNKPIVTTSIGEIAKYHDGHSILVVDRDDFVSSLGKVISYRGKINNILPDRMTWRFKSDYILSRVLPL